MKTNPYRGVHVQGTNEQIQDRIDATMKRMPPLHGKVLDADVANHFRDLLKDRFSIKIIGFATSIDFNTMPFDINNCDFVLSFEVLEHVSNPQFYLNEIHKSLKENGKLILTTPVGIFPPFMWGKYHFCEYNKKHLYELLQGLCGFTIIRLERFPRKFRIGIRPILRYLFGGCWYLEAIKGERSQMKCEYCQAQADTECHYCGMYICGKQVCQSMHFTSKKHFKALAQANRETEALKGESK